MGNPDNPGVYRTTFAVFINRLDFYPAGHKPSGRKKRLQLRKIAPQLDLRQPTANISLVSYVSEVILLIIVSINAYSYNSHVKHLIIIDL